MQQHKIGWGVDGYGRCALCFHGNDEIIFHGLKGVSAIELVETYRRMGWQEKSSTRGDKEIQ